MKVSAAATVPLYLSILISAIRWILQQNLENPAAKQIAEQNTVLKIKTWRRTKMNDCQEMGRNTVEEGIEGEEGKRREEKGEMMLSSRDTWKEGKANDFLFLLYINCC